MIITCSMTSPGYMNSAVLDEDLSNRNMTWTPTNISMCELLQLSTRQLEICQQESSLGDVLAAAVRMSAFECQRQFRYERWNCSLGQKRLNLLKQSKVIF